MTIERRPGIGGGSVIMTECPYCGAPKDEWEQRKLPYHLPNCPGREL